MICDFSFFNAGLEGRAAQSNSPVDCCDRERPSDRSRANQVLSPQPTESLEIITISRLFLFIYVHIIISQNA
jgi:hypothetical protein